MKILNLTDDMEPFLGKIVVSCIILVDAEMATDKVRIYYDVESNAELGWKLPALIYGATPLYEPEWRKIWRLLGEKKVGLLVADDTARLIYRKTGRKADGIALYGDDGFWREVAGYVAKYRKAFRPETVLALAKMFKGHLAGLRIFFDTPGTIINTLMRGQGETSINNLRYWWEEALIDVRPYTAYPLPAKHLEFILDIMRLSNYEFIRRLEETGIDIVLLGEITEPIEFHVKIEGEPDKIDLAYRLLKLLHPKAVERKDEKTLVVSALF